jgi:transcription elongation factor Elf1
MDAITINFNKTGILFEMNVLNDKITLNGIHSFRNFLTNVKLEEPKIELFVKLFNKDNTFQNMLIKKITEKKDVYVFKMYSFKKEKFETLTMDFNKNKSWKVFKKMVLNYIADEECVVCFEKSFVKISCDTCLQPLCVSCLIKQFGKMCRLKCPMCNLALEENSIEQQNDIYNNMRNLPIEIRNKIAHDYIHELMKKI